MAKKASKKAKKMSTAATADLLAQASKTFGKAKPFVSRMATTTASALFGGVSKAGVRRGSKRKIANKGTNQIPLPILRKRLASLEKTVRERSGVVDKDDSKNIFSAFK